MATQLLDPRMFWFDGITNQIMYNPGDGAPAEFPYQGFIGDSLRVVTNTAKLDTPYQVDVLFIVDGMVYLGSLDMLIEDIFEWCSQHGILLAISTSAIVMVDSR